MREVAGRRLKSFDMFIEVLTELQWSNPVVWPFGLVGWGLAG